MAHDVIDFMDALNIQNALIAGFDWGARSANIVAAMWPDRCKAIVADSGYLIVNLQDNQQPLSPQAELNWWYQYYFATGRGVRGYRANTRAFNKFIWQRASPRWKFDDPTYERTATAFDSPDHLQVVVHNYRWRLGLALSEPRYDDTAAVLATKPAITVPNVTIGSKY